MTQFFKECTTSTEIGVYSNVYLIGYEFKKPYIIANLPFSFIGLYFNL